MGVIDGSVPNPRIRIGMVTLPRTVGRVELGRTSTWHATEHAATVCAPSQSGYVSCTVQLIRGYGDPRKAFWRVTNESEGALILRHAEGTTELGGIYRKFPKDAAAQVFHESAEITLSPGYGKSDALSLPSPLHYATAMRNARDEAAGGGPAGWIKGGLYRCGIGPLFDTPLAPM